MLDVGGYVRAWCGSIWYVIRVANFEIRQGLTPYTQPFNLLFYLPNAVGSGQLVDGTSLKSGSIDFTTPRITVRN